MRLVVLLPFVASTLAHADASVAPSATTVALHALAHTAWPGPSTELARGGAFVAVREGIDVVVPGHYSYHRLVIDTARGQLVDDFGNQLFDDEPARDHSLVGPMSAHVDDGVLLVRGRHAIWKRDFTSGSLHPTYSCEELLVACVIGADGEPRCTPPLLVGDESACEEADAPGGGNWSVRHWDWHISPKVAGSDRDLRIDCGRGRAPNQCRITIATSLRRAPPAP